MDPVSNFGTYRSSLEKAIGQADASKDGPHSWVVPFFSLIVKDVYFLHQGMSDRDIRGFIRFEKCMSLARLVSQILSYKDRVVRQRLAHRGRQRELCVGVGQREC